MEQEVTSKQWRRKHWQRPRTEHRRDWKLKGPKREQVAPSPTQVYMSKRKAKEKTPLIQDSDFLVVVWKATKFWLFANGCKAAVMSFPWCLTEMLWMAKKTTAFCSVPRCDHFWGHGNVLENTNTSSQRQWLMGGHPWKHAPIPFFLFKMQKYELFHIYILYIQNIYISYIYEMIYIFLHIYT